MRENTQLPIAADYDFGGGLKLHSVFPTIQGEGPFCGERALFFRLHGCNLRCPGCDTDYTSKTTYIGPNWMASKAKDIGWAEGALVVITGGEPFRQNIMPAIDALLAAGYRVQVETNGVLWPPNFNQRGTSAEWFSIVCSPKTSRIHDEVFRRAAAFKYVLQAGNVGLEDGLPLRALMHPASPQVARPRPGALVYVQPMDEDDPAANALNLAVAIQSTMRFGHRLQIQVHKIINME